MNWVYRFDERALKDFGNLVRRPVGMSSLIWTNVSRARKIPAALAKRLKAELAGLWRYRVGDYRILCQIQDHELVVLVVAVGHRRNVYD
jgi:mRNA interferase RelE/StbE